MPKVIFVGVVTATLFASQAAAQAWNGPYAGLQAGYGAGKSDTETALGGRWTVESQALQDHVADVTSSNPDPNGLTYGAQAGYNLRASSNIVVGAEIDYALFDVEGDHRNGPTPVPALPGISYTVANSVDSKQMISLRAKAGYAFGGSLLYLHGGVAWLKAEFETSLTSNGGYLKAGARTKTANGLIAGAGFEQLVGRSVSARLEYSYTDQGRVRSENAYLPGSTFVSPAYSETYRHDLKLHLIRAGLNLHF